MDKPRVEIKYVDNTETEGYLRVVVNGLTQPPIRIDFEPGNDAKVHMTLSKTIEAVYKMGVNDGERTSKLKMCELIDWANSL